MLDMLAVIDSLPLPQAANLGGVFVHWCGHLLDHDVYVLIEANEFRVIRDFFRLVTPLVSNLLSSSCVRCPALSATADCPMRQATKSSTTLEFGAAGTGAANNIAAAIRTSFIEFPLEPFIPVQLRPR
jgi:hypothetical protein